MEFAFPWPLSQGEWLAWSVAAFTVALGLFGLVAPGRSLAARAVSSGATAPASAGSLRGPLSGFHLGVGLSCLMLAQPMIYIALGAAWIFSALGRLAALAAGQGSTPAGWLWLVAELALGALPLAYVFGFIA